MSGTKRAKDLSKASKYLSTIDIDFKGDDKELVEMLIREAYISGLNNKVASEDNSHKEDDIHQIVSVSYCFRKSCPHQTEDNKCDRGDNYGIFCRQPER